MALRFPARTRSSTSTTGLGTYTLTEPTSAGWRNFTRAVVDGDLADGDQVGYAVMDTTVTGGPKLVEVGRGTYNDTAKTLTRDVIYQPNGSAIDWGAGTRDVIVLDLPQLAVWLIDDQTVAGEKTFSDVLRAVVSGTAFVGDGSSPIIAQRSGSISDNCRIAVISGTSGQSEVSLGDTDSQYVGRVIYNNSAGTMGVYTEGVLRAQFSASWARFTPAVQDSAGVPYDKFPSGTRLLLGNNSVPSGWAIVAGLADKTILLTSTPSEIDDTGGSWTISGLSAGNTTLTIAQMPAHTHGPAIGTKFPSLNSTTGNLDRPFSTGSVYSEEATTASAGGGGSHTHTVSQDGSWRPSYQKWGAIQKN